MREWYPLAASSAALALTWGWPGSPRHSPSTHPGYMYLMLMVTGVFLALPVIGRFFPALRTRLAERSAFHAAVILAGAVYALVTAKLAWLPPVFFPAPDRILSVFIDDGKYLVWDCLGASLRLLGTGFVAGAAAGFMTGIAVGFSRRAAYWVNPLIRFLGPVPPTAWIPLALVAFPTTFMGAAFLIALSVWFPVTVMTSSGIANIPNAFFEVAGTLGAKRAQQIWRVGIPSALPSIFVGLFSGTCASFLTLMTAEMLGVKNGIGWYVNWQREMMAYAHVYAGLILIAITFYALITLLFRIRDRLLVWQKGMIKW